jgi:hypothetical protein
VSPGDRSDAFDGSDALDGSDSFDAGTDAGDAVDNGSDLDLSFDEGGESADGIDAGTDQDEGQDQGHDQDQGQDQDQDQDNVVCADDLVSDLVVCATNPRLIITSPNYSSETPLPGCAGKPNVVPLDCRHLESMEDEVYAVRFKFAEITGKFKDSDIVISTTTRDGMIRDADMYRKFDMSVSTIPGDFEGRGEGWGPWCLMRWATDGTELRINGKQVKNFGDPVGAYECPLVPGTQYYINVKAAEPGCHDLATDTYPTYGCLVTVGTNVPASIDE